MIATEGRRIGLAQQSRKRRPQWLVVWFLVVASAFFTTSAGPTVAGTLEEPERGPATLIYIDEFEVKSDDPRLAFLRTGGVGMLRSAFLSKSELAVVSAEDLLAEGISPAPARNRVAILKLLKKYQNQVRLDVYYFGGYFESLEHRLIWRGVLIRVATDERVDLGPLVVDIDDIFGTMLAAAESVVSNINVFTEAGITDWTLMVAVLCFQREGDAETKLPALYGYEIGTSLASVLSKVEGVASLDPDTIDTDCDGKLDASTVTQLNEGNALISGTFVLKGETIAVLPQLTVIGHEGRIIMPRYLDTLSRFFVEGERYLYEISDYLDALLTDVGYDGLPSVVSTDHTPRYHFQQAEELLDAQKYRLARPHLQVLVDLVPASPWAHFALGMSNLLTGNTRRAIESLETALSLDPDFAWSYYVLGLAHFEAAEYQEAIEAYTKAYEYKRKKPLAELPTDIPREIGFAYLLLDDETKADHWFEEAIRLNENDIQSYRLLAFSAQRQDMFEAAERWLRRALEVSPGHEGALDDLQLLALGLADEEEYDLALRAMVLVLQHRNTPNAYEDRAQVQTYRAISTDQDYTSAIADLEMAIQLEEEFPDRPQGASEWARLSLSELYILTGRYGDAVRVAKEALQKIRTKPYLRQIGAYLRLVAEILHGKDYEPAFHEFKRELAVRSSLPYDEEPSWDFTVLEDYVLTNRNIYDDQRNLIVSITEEVMETPAVGQ